MPKPTKISIRLREMTAPETGAFAASVAEMIVTLVAHAGSTLSPVDGPGRSPMARQPAVTSGR